MGVQDTFVNGLTACVGGGFTFPAINLPGFTNFALASFESPFAGFNYILGFIPPDPHHLPSIPDISLFLDPFMASINLPANYPAFSLSLAGVSISIPQKGTGISPYPLFGPFDPSFGFNVGGFFTTMFISVAAPFLICKQIITGIINNLTLTLPTLPAIQAIISGLILALGFGSAQLPNIILGYLIAFGGCLATAIFNLMGSIL